MVADLILRIPMDMYKSHHRHLEEMGDFPGIGKFRAEPHAGLADTLPRCNYLSGDQDQTDGLQLHGRIHQISVRRQFNRRRVSTEDNLKNYEICDAEYLKFPKKQS